MFTRDRFVPAFLRHPIVRPMAATLLLGLSLLFRLPSLIFADTLAPAAGFHLSYPGVGLVLAPLCSFADLLSMTGDQQWRAVFLYLGIGLLLLRTWRQRAALALAAAAFMFWGVLVPRPMSRLIAEDPDVILVDFHSHTELSHDGRAGFSPERNAEWHRKQGYGAAFITDHNEVRGALDASLETNHKPGYRSLVGEELSLFRTHLLVLGGSGRIDNRPFCGQPFLVKGAIQQAHALNLPAIAALPEYWRYHWRPPPSACRRPWTDNDRDDRLARSVLVPDLVAAGIDGFELANADPKALDMPLPDRRALIALCRRNNLLMVGSTDIHGYGSATENWNAMRIPGWRNLSAPALQATILRTLKERRFDALRIVERQRVIPDSNGFPVLAPPKILLLYLRSMTGPTRLAWLAWVWAGWGLLRVRERLFAPRGEGIEWTGLRPLETVSGE